MGRRPKHEEAEPDETGNKEDEVDLTWVGSFSLGLPRYLKKSGAPVKKYDTVTIKIGSSGEFSCGTGDFVHLRTGEDYGEPFVGRIVDFFEDAKGQKLGTVQWMYRPSDIPKDAAGSARVNDRDEIVYAAEHLDKIAVETIIETFRVEFLVVMPDGSVQKRKSELHADAEDPFGSSHTCLYRCSRIFDLSTNVVPISEAIFKLIEKNMSISVEQLGGKAKLADASSKKSVTSSTRSQGSAAKGYDEDEDNKQSASPSSDSGPDESSSDEGITRLSRSKKKKKQQPRRSTRRDLRDGGDDEVFELVSNKKARTVTKPPKKIQEISSGEEESEVEVVEGDDRPLSKKRKGSRLLLREVVDDADFIAHQEAALAASPRLVGAQPIVTRSTPSKPRGPPPVDVDERLWALFQQVRNEIGSDDALEILGYLKLEMLVDNASRLPNRQIAPPVYLQTRMTSSEVRPHLNKSLAVLGISLPTSVDGSSHVYHAGAVKRAFEELERCRPGIIFSQLGQGTTQGHWLFPETQRHTYPVFGALLGLDGFRTCQMTFQRQTMHVPIDREGSVAQAAVRGFARLVTSNYAFTLIRTGDFTFEVAPSPDESCEQIFVKGARMVGNNKTLCLSVPTKKALLRFVKVLVREHEGVPLSQQRFKLDEKQFGAEVDDDLPLTQCGVKASTTLRLVISK